MEDKRLRPYEFVYDHPNWLLIGFSPESGDNELIKLNLIKGVSITSVPFQKDMTSVLTGTVALPGELGAVWKPKSNYSSQEPPSRKFFRKDFTPKRKLLR